MFLIELAAKLLKQKHVNTNTALLVLILAAAVIAKQQASQCRTTLSGMTTDISDIKDNVSDEDRHLQAIDDAFENDFHIRIESPKQRGWHGGLTVTNRYVSVQALGLDNADRN